MANAPDLWQFDTEPSILQQISPQMPAETAYKPSQNPVNSRYALNKSMGISNTDGHVNPALGKKTFKDSTSFHNMLNFLTHTRKNT